MSKNYVFISSFAPMLKGFLNEKRSLGYKYESESYWLHQFDVYCFGNHASPILSRDLVTLFIEQDFDPNTSVKTMRNILVILRQFAIYLQRNGFDAYLFPLDLFPKKEDTYQPYIFTRDEIRKFLKAVEELPYNKEFPVRHIVIPLLFRTLYCCGLRISEVLNLKIKDVDLKNGVLYLYDTKDYHDRLIPLNENLHKRYIFYLNQVLYAQDGERYFFPSADGRRYQRASIANIFRNILWKCGISYGGRKKGPHLHDLSYPNLNKIQTFF